MALERQSIEKKDFPIGRRGYDPEAVDAHLSALADEVEELKRSARRRTESLAASASEQVRAIVEAAETSAAEIQRQAEDEAREIRAEATQRGAGHPRARRPPRRATTSASVSESTSAMLQRLDAMEGELRSADRVAAHRLEPPQRRSAAARGQPDEVSERGRAAAAVRARGLRRPRSRGARAAAGAARRRPRTRRGHRARQPARSWPTSAAGADAGREADGRRHRGRPPDRAQHGAERHAARGDRPLPGRELRAQRPRGGCSTRSTRRSRAERRPAAAATAGAQAEPISANASPATGTSVRSIRLGYVDQLVVSGAREHNLKDITVAIPRDSLTVITGLSGSGKSSLAFDTIYAEGQRRYVESLSAYARQFLGQMDKPDVDSIEGLSPAISIDQKTTSRNPRSTVGTVTEIYDYLRLLWARIGHPHCHICGRPITRPVGRADHRPGDGAARGRRASWCWRRSSAAARASTASSSRSCAARASPGPRSTASCAGSTRRSCSTRSSSTTSRSSSTGW